MMRRKKRKEGSMLKKIALVVLVLVVVLAVIGFFLGIYSPVSIEKATAGPYQIVCLDHIGPYKGICKKIQNVKKLLDEQEIIPVAACGIYYDNPKTVPSDKLRSKGGFIVEGDVEVEILERLDISHREVVIAKVKAHPAIAPIKTYAKLGKWLGANNFTVAGPCLEIYHDTGVVEVQMPISPVPEEV